MAEMPLQDAAPATPGRPWMQVRSKMFRSISSISRLLLKLLHRFTSSSPAATCQSGYGAVCKTVYPGSIPGVASSIRLRQRTIIPDKARLPWGMRAFRAGEAA
jgi:hypothetical protein